MNRAQLSMEFILLFTLTFVVFLILVGIAISGFSDQSQDSSIRAADSLASSIALHLDMIGRGPGDVTYVFPLPNKIDEQNYSVEFRDSGLVLVRIIGSDVVSVRPTLPFGLSGNALETSDGGEEGRLLQINRASDDPADCTFLIERVTGALQVKVDDC